MLKWEELKRKWLWSVSKVLSPGIHLQEQRKTNESAKIANILAKIPTWYLLNIIQKYYCWFEFNVLLKMETHTTYIFFFNP